MSFVTPFTGEFEEGPYNVNMPINVEVAGKTYVFQQWENGEVTPVRVLSLVAPTNINAKYTLETPPPPPPPPPVEFPVMAVIAVGGVIALIAYIALSR